MELVPATAGHATTVAGWPLSAGEVVLWCGGREFPVPARTVEAWRCEDDVRAHVLVEDGTALGYGELWLDTEEDEVELARIIVAPGARGRGVGGVLVRGLLARALETGHGAVFMRVHPDNDRALRCYLRAGFTPVDAVLAEEWNAVQPVAYTWLTHDPTARRTETGPGGTAV
jgi:ribosomal protein S18 acetylase RimI-like enzyme